MQSMVERVRVARGTIFCIRKKKHLHIIPEEIWNAIRKRPIHIGDRLLSVNKSKQILRRINKFA